MASLEKIDLSVKKTYAKNWGLCSNLAVIDKKSLFAVNRLQKCLYPLKCDMVTIADKAVSSKLWAEAIFLVFVLGCYSISISTAFSTCWILTVRGCPLSAVCLLKLPVLQDVWGVFLHKYVSQPRNYHWQDHKKINIAYLSIYVIYFNV